MLLRTQCRLIIWNQACQGTISIYSFFCPGQFWGYCIYINPSLEHVEGIHNTYVTNYNYCTSPTSGYINRYIIVVTSPRLLWRPNVTSTRLLWCPNGCFARQACLGLHRNMWRLVGYWLIKKKWQIFHANLGRDSYQYINIQYVGLLDQGFRSCNCCIGHPAQPYHCEYPTCQCMLGNKQGWIPPFLKGGLNHTSLYATF